MGKLNEIKKYLRLSGMRIAWLALILLVVSLVLVLLNSSEWIIFFVTFVIWLVVFLSSYQSAKLNLEISASSRQMENIISNLRDGVIFYDEQFRIKIFNHSAETIFSVKKEEVLNKVFGPELAGEPQWRVLAQTIFPSLAPLVVWRSEVGTYPQVVDVSFTDPNLDLRVTTDRLFDSAGQIIGFVKIVHNRTDEIALAKSESEFVTVTAHQLRTPLTGINWSLQSIASDPEAGENAKDLASTAMQVSEKLLKTVDNLLDVSKMESGALGYSFEDVNMVAFINSQLNAMLLVAKTYGVSLYFDHGAEQSIPARIDPNRLGLALTNLVDNDIKYNTPNGSVTVKIERQKDKPYLLVDISDTGIGIPPDALNKLFAKFFRAPNAVSQQTEGTGLGLYMTKGIIERHGGKIWVRSTLGRGTTFSFTLPTDPNLIPPKEMINLV